MIDTQTEQVILCRTCHKPLQQRRGKRARLYCNDVCKTTYHRQKEREEEQAARLSRWRDYLPETQQVLADVQVHSAELAERVASAINAGGAQQVEVYQEKLAACASRIENLERQVEVQRDRLGQYYQSSGTQAARITDLEEENRKLQDRLNVDARYLVDTEPRHFKAWLRKRAFPQGSFAERFLADTRFKPQASRAKFEAELKVSGYSEQDIQTFRDLWKAMLLQS